MDKIVYELDSAKLVAGTRYRGDMEEKLTNILDIVKANPNVIIFIDELHTFLKLGASSDDSSGAGQLLPTSLADGCINHRQYVKEFKAIGFDGPIGIEAPRPGDREHFAKEDFEYIQPIIRKF